MDCRRIFAALDSFGGRAQHLAERPDARVLGRMPLRLAVCSEPFGCDVGALVVAEGSEGFALVDLFALPRVCAETPAPTRPHAAT
jgi:hypothetical protein